MLPYQPIYNMLELADPYEWNCTIQYYTNIQDEMLIKAVHSTDRNQKFFIVVSFTHCFSGPVSWQGAMLSRGSKDQFLEFRREMIPGDKLTDEELLEPSRYGELFVFLAEDYRVRIIALGVSKCDISDPVFRIYDR